MHIIRLIQRQIKKFSKKKLALISALVFFVLLFSLAIVSFEIKYRDKFFPRVTIAGESVGGKSYLEVSGYFKEKVDQINKNGLTFNIEGSNGKKQINFPEFSSGLTSDKVVEYFSLSNWEETLKTAYETGRENSLWQKIIKQSSGFFKKRNFIFSPVIQKETSASFLEGELEDFLVKTVPASFSVKNGEISILHEVIGEKISAKEIISNLEKKLSLADVSPTDFTPQKEFPISTEKKLLAFSNFAEQVRNKIKIVFHYNDYVWKVSGDTLVTWLTIKENDKIGVDKKILENYFNKTVLFYIDSPMQNSHFEVRDDKLVEISQGKAGNVLDIKKNTDNIEDIVNNRAYGQNDSFDSAIIDLSIETIIEEPKITKETINKYQIKELVGSAKTNFKGGSLDRQHNIEVGVSKLNGILLAPGEEFSAVKAIGGVTEEAGFVKEYVINQGKTQKEIGGGLCQIATTLFRLALDSGLPITERVNHRYVISYYGAGLDATIYEPHPDLRFRNDTGNYLLLQGKAVNNEVVFEFYGKKDGRTVKISEPTLYRVVSPPPPKYIPTADLRVGTTKCSEIPHNGVTADATYTVSYANGEVVETKFHSVYQPWQKVCLVGTGS